jgi:hypothetical protein
MNLLHQAYFEKTTTYLRQTSLTIAGDAQRGAALFFHCNHRRRRVVPAQQTSVQTSMV